MAGLLALSRAIDRINEFVGRWVSWLILVAILVSAVNAVIRKTFWPFVYYAGVSGCLGYAILWHSAKGWLNLGSMLLMAVLFGMIWFAWRELRNSNNHSDDD